MDKLRDTESKSEERAGDSIARPPATRLGRLWEGVIQGLLWVGASAMFLIMMLTVVDVFGRKFFRHPMPGTIETIELLLVFAAFTGMFAVTARQRNVGVDILTMHFSLRAKLILASVSHLLGAIAFAVMAWQLAASAADWMGFGASTPTTAILYIPLYPFKFVSAVGAGLISLLLWVSFFRSLGSKELETSSGAKI